MRDYDNEMKFIAHLLNPVANRKVNLFYYLNTIDESRCLETISQNRVAVEFKRNLEKNSLLEKKFFSNFPLVKIFLDHAAIRIHRDSLDFSRIKAKFAAAGIDFLLIKSDGDFPFQSDNLDMLIKPNRLIEVVQILKEFGYYELDFVREPHKFLFRNTRAYAELPLHIHTRVEWEGTQFVSLEDLWRRCRISSEKNGFLIPSPEDTILIRVAHLFFENHQIRLNDVIKVDNAIRSNNLDWEYMLSHARRLHWGDGFCLTMCLLNQVYIYLYGQKMLEQQVFLKMERMKCCNRLFVKAINPYSSDVTLLKIPYAISGLFFLHKILDQSDMTLAERFNHMAMVITRVAKRRVLAVSTSD